LEYFYGISGLSFVYSFDTNPISMRSTILKSVYLLVGIAGMVGTVIIILKVINLPSISDLEMVLIFSLGCLSLWVMWAGFYGLRELTRIPDKQKTSIIHATH
jgi:hypothetical protein